ncbi:2-dehydro-3-deoxyphosphogluconate aldolase, partial [Micromonospora sp. NPDC005220]
MTTPDFDHIFGGARVMAILRGLPVAETVRLAERAWDLGIDVVEVPVATADAVPALRAAVEAGAERDRIVGAGPGRDGAPGAPAAAAGAPGGGGAGSGPGPPRWRAGGGG